MDYIIYIIRAAAIAVCVFLLCFICHSCRSVQYIPQIRTERVHDTLALHDSVYISRNVYTRGDTVFQKDTVYRFRYRDKIIEHATCDSIPYPVDVPVRVRNWYDKTTSAGFWLFVLIIVLRIAWAIAKRNLKK